MPLIIDLYLRVHRAPCLTQKAAASDALNFLALDEGADVGRLIALSTDHFNLRLLVEEACCEIDIADVNVVRHVLAEGI